LLPPDELANLGNGECAFAWLLLNGLISDTLDCATISPGEQGPNVAIGEMEQFIMLD